ncbi:hypothetical protein [Candidatus Nitrosocosmicus sp. FF01]|uniref:hypothetical protein n=1 Tax=Candidatus Nitrosocosmicus sp. FF01 TaxID=3397670 RepID=UPI0039E7D22A
MEQLHEEEKSKEPIGVFGRLFTGHATARILDYFISHRFHSYSADQVAKDLVLSKEIVSEAIDRLEKREIVRPDKRIENAADETTYTLFVESMTTNAIIRAAFEIANAERVSSEKQNKE